MSFTEMMQQAIQIRTSTDAKLRVDFDARPKFQQTSMFATKEVQEARDLPLEERLAACTAMKVKGNEQIRNGHPDEACQTYEQALAIFWYLENRNESWKTSGIRDEDIAEINFRPACATDAQEGATRDIKVSLLLNIAQAYSAQNDHGTSVKACSAALSLNPSCAKGLYLRGKALVAPASAGAFEAEEAIRDVRQAADLAPGDSTIKAFLAKLRSERARQKEADRATFAGMFGRGSVCDPQAESKAGRLHHASTHGKGTPETEALSGEAAGSGREKTTPTELAAAEKKASAPGWEAADAGGLRSCGGRAPGAEGEDAAEARRHVEERVAFFKRMVRECENEEGREEEADQYRERIQAIEEILSDHDRQARERAAADVRDNPCGVDWRNPSQAMRKKAEEEEYDLDNPAVVSFLVKMQEVRRTKVEEEVRSGTQEDGGGGGCDGGVGNEACTTDREQRSPGEEDHMDDWTEEIWEGAIRCMSRAEVSSLLEKELGVDPQPTTTPLRELRDLAVRKLLGGRPSGQETGRSSSPSRKRTSSDEGPSRKRADWKITASITLVLLVFKASQMGLWKWLATGGELRAGAAGPPPAPIRSGGNSFGGQGRGRAKGRGRHWGDKGRRSFPPVSGAAEGAAEGGVGANSLAEVALESAVQVADSAVGEEQCAGGFVGNDGIDGICQPVDT